MILSRTPYALNNDEKLWRRERLDRAGFPAEIADALACDPWVNIEACEQLAARGCPPELIRDIVAEVVA